MQRALVAPAQPEEGLQTDMRGHVAWSVAYRSRQPGPKPTRFGYGQAGFARYTDAKHTCSRMAKCILAQMDTLGIEPRASRMLGGRDTTTPRALERRGKQLVSFLDYVPWTMLWQVVHLSEMIAQCKNL